MMFKFYLKIKLLKIRKINLKFYKKIKVNNMRIYLITLKINSTKWKQKIPEHQIINDKYKNIKF